MNKTIGMFAHVDAGKTTFAEQLLYHTNSIRRRGRVDHKDAYLDSHEIEKERGITVFADQAVMDYNGSAYFLIDTPGHVDFSPEMERAIQAMDAAVVIVSAVEGVQGHTETVWRLLERHRVPAFLFINKTDRTGADAERTLAEIRSELSAEACDFARFFSGPIDEETAAFLAERDEQLLSLYMEENFAAADWFAAIRRMVRERRLFPCMSGSALQDIGVTEFMALLDALTVTEYDEQAPFAGRVYKVRYDENGTRITFVKALGGTLRVREEVLCGSGDDRAEEKVTQIRFYSGSRFQQADAAAAGQLFAVTGLISASAGDGIGALTDKAGYEIVPTMISKVSFDPKLGAKDVLRYFRMLDAEDPSLRTEWDEQLQDIHIRVMGAIQLEVLQRVVKERFGLEVEFGSPDILYKETITAPAVGSAHFEPLGHYAEVHLRLEPGERGSGIVFHNECHPDQLTTNYQHLVRQHLFEKEHRGLLTGSPVTDLVVTLLKGRAHNKHTSGGDFREAAFRALRQGLEKTESVLLEPYYTFRIKVGIDQMGKVLSDLQQAHGRFDPPDTAGGKAVITGTAPVATMLNYGRELAAFTQGRGAIALAFAGYDRCHNAEEVIRRRGYNKDADPSSTSASIFCAKGQGYTVPWDEADRLMHV
ncbi:GTP-binding protein [Paenibacillus humicola]|uniref:GTP-binding protein n=1 Tax=Paenibacillus humicola TaxID=3110540 RepID=UPI00237BB6DB|nr:TetM/TetW/TetO/TetS family tetracycline resistance ribosomal protection protein [Paenibacillus humicola]